MTILTLGQWMAELATEAVAIEAKAEVAQAAGIAAGITEAKALVPVLTGALRESIEIDEDGYGSDLDYAGFVEYGTSDTAPQPYMGPSADAAAKVFVAGLVATVGP